MIDIDAVTKRLDYLSKHMPSTVTVTRTKRELPGGRERVSEVFHDERRKVIDEGWGYAETVFKRELLSGARPTLPASYVRALIDFSEAMLPNLTPESRESRYRSSPESCARWSASMPA
jgi:hypothetical protein